jgi:hypothetical protein
VPAEFVEEEFVEFHPLAAILRPPRLNDQTTK